MFDRVVLNNSVFALKGKIGRAKIHIINALVKKVRKLKLKAEKDPRSKSKMENTLSEIQTLKKLNMGQSVKQVLSDTSNPLEIIKLPTSTPEERAMARLFSHPVVVAAVSSIKTELNLKNEDEDWRSFVLKIGQINKEKAKVAKKELRKKEKARKKEVIKKNKAKETELTKSSPGNDLVKPKSKQEKGKEVALSDKRCLETQPSEPKINQGKKYRKHSVSEDEESNSKQIIDPFFVTEKGQNYKANVKINKPNQSEDEGSDSDIQKPYKQFGTVSQSHQQNRFERRNGVKKFNTNSSDKQSNTYKDFSKRQPPQYRQNNNDNKRKFNDTVENNDDANEDLHPSWAAKKRQQKIVADFQGTKIRFDADGDVTKNSTDRSFGNGRKEFSKGFKKDVHVETNLHPSWEAKMKQKAVVEFKGSKITFDPE